LYFKKDSRIIYKVNLENNREGKLLKIINVTKNFGGLRALDKCSLEVGKNSITALIGPNGAGKTTLFNVISGFLRIDKGEMYFKGENIAKTAIYEIALNGLSRTFQTAEGFLRMTVLENLMIAPRYQEGEKLFKALFNTKKQITQEKENKEKALELLNYLGLYDRRNEYVKDLSSTQSKLLEICRQLMMDPDILLLDEPMAGVDPSFQGVMLKYLNDLREGGLTLFIIEHNLGFVREISDIVYVMSYGRVITKGAWNEIIKDEKVITIYLGREGKYAKS